MTLTYGSVCSGIEAATVAWHPLGWRPQFFSEIEAAPRAVLIHRWPGVPLHGDFTTIREGEYGPIDLLVGGTPCQDFSVAGLRAGVAGERGNLTLEFLRLAKRLRPRWVVWENVPGVLSSVSHVAPDPCPPPPPVDLGCDGAELETEDEYSAEELHAFNSFLAGLSELGYGFSYRVLDAQYVRVDGFGRAVPQRRRRVFVVGHLGDWRRAAAVLFERACLRGDPAPRREAGAGAAVDTLAGADPGGGWRVGADEAAAGQLVAEQSRLHLQGLRGGERSDVVADVRMVRSRAYGGDTARSRMIAAPFAPAISASNPYGDHESREGPLVAHSLRGEGFDASEDGTGRGTPIVPVAGTLCFNGKAAGSATSQDAENGMLVAFDTTQITSALNRSAPQPGDPCHPLAAGAHLPAIAFSCKDHGADATDEGVTPTLRAMGFAESHANAGGQLAIAQGWAVRRLTPLECERLQGFPDGYTAVPWRGGVLADGPRYKVLGNSMAVNCMRWIGRRIEAVDAIADAEALMSNRKGRAA